MSTKELLEEANKLLSSNWENHEKELVKRMIDSLIAYKSLIPKSLKNDVKAMLQMANRIKTEYDELLQKYKAEKESHNEQDNLEQIEKDLDKLEDNLEILDNS
jgi:hypothetical protein